MRFYSVLIVTVLLMIGKGVCEEAKKKESVKETETKAPAKSQAHPLDAVQSQNLLGDFRKFKEAVLAQSPESKEWQGRFSNGWHAHFWHRETTGIIWFGKTRGENGKSFGIINSSGKSSGEIFSRKVEVKAPRIYKFIVFYKTTPEVKANIGFRFKGDLDVKLLKHDPVRWVGKAWKSKGNSFLLHTTNGTWRYFRCKYQVTRGSGTLEVVFKNQTSGEYAAFLFRYPTLIAQ
ncbi:MAG: hypothetical protein D6820_07360 [Lentisphaerae bacterium]|nr:MAG: hypothetical protein D6820_07360 [Lentisphaerota bacterium]